MTCELLCNLRSPVNAFYKRAKLFNVSPEKNEGMRTKIEFELRFLETIHFVAFPEADCSVQNFALPEVACSDRWHSGTYTPLSWSKVRALPSKLHQQFELVQIYRRVRIKIKLVIIIHPWPRNTTPVKLIKITSNQFRHFSIEDKKNKLFIYCCEWRGGGEDCRWDEGSVGLLFPYHGPIVLLILKLSTLYSNNL